MTFHLPNILTFSRILVIPVFIGTFYLDAPLSNWVALALFLAAAITDFFDGYVARSQNLVSSFGRFLDPIADKLLVATAIIMLVAYDRITGFAILAAVVIMCREILVSGLREYLAEIKVGVRVTRLAKWKTTAQITALSFLILHKAAPWNLPVPEIGTVLLWIAAALTIYTGYDYLRTGLKHII